MKTTLELVVHINAFNEDVLGGYLAIFANGTLTETLARLTAEEVLPTMRWHPVGIDHVRFERV